MQTHISIVEKLVIFDYPFCLAYYAEYGKGGKGWHGITPEQAEKTPVKETYEGAAATRKLWEIRFDELSDADKKLVIAVFPNVLSKDKLPTKNPRDILECAVASVRFSFGVKCPRCGGEGRYPSRVDNGVCHKCHGSGVVLPRLTDKKLVAIAKHYAEVAK